LRRIELRRLQALLARLDDDERKLLYRRATNLRNTTLRDSGRASSLDYTALGILAEDDAGRSVEGADAAVGPVLLAGTVTSVAQGRCVLTLDGVDDRTVACTVTPAALRELPGGLAVGDQAMVHVADMESAEGVLQSVSPRRSQLTRADPHNPRAVKVLAANIDVAVVVVPLARPGVKPRFIDRFLLVAARGGVRPLICASKLDLVDGEAREKALAPLAPYREIGLAALPISSVTGEGLAELRAALAESTCVFLGQSGVGKTTLLNALAPGLDLLTGTVRGADGRGRHTTSQSSMHSIGDGIRVIDTAGIRQLGMGEVTPDELESAFEDFALEAQGCRFNDCSHTHEPGCAVKAAVAAGRIDAARYESYLRMAAAGGDGKPPARGAPRR
jgi:ribosome biogenesis GTPase / thiamine phosphate phosphatase